MYCFMEWWDSPDELEPDTLEPDEILLRIAFLQRQIEAFPSMPKAGTFV